MKKAAVEKGAKSMINHELIAYAPLRLRLLSIASFYIKLKQQRYLEHVILVL
jgi:hypothetical protein